MKHSLPTADQLVETLLAEPSLLTPLLSTFADKVLLVGSRGSGRQRPDSDVDLHIKDMMETDETYDAITAFLEKQGVQFGGDKYGAGSIIVPEQDGYPVSVEFGFWDGIPEDPQCALVDVFGVKLQAPQADPVR